ncbi:hypothetical protein [Pseudomonas japonica]|uniref:Uncharacterized protein n=1 Tax=Pseudomonas japonica TaxID=256466 RepID=A0A239KVA1_9PSED|nr:hypothetical protein [Pseudomonas japonica]SNT21144.1 hypothetical protein SAMN05444352_1292 [Pseudomonas japonica]
MDDVRAGQVNTGEDPAWLQLSVVRTQLLSVRFADAIYTRALSGRHWISSDGADFTIGPGEGVKLRAGLALIGGEGVLQLALATGCEQRRVSASPGWLGRLFKRRSAALQIKINQGA